MAPLAILGGESVAEVLARLLRGTPLAHVLAGGNGAAGPVRAALEPERASTRRSAPPRPPSFPPAPSAGGAG